MISYVLFVFSFLVSITGGVEGATSVYKPTEVFLFNCGNTADNVDLNGRNWMAENRKILPLNSDNASISSDTLYQDSRVHQVPYMKARIFRYDFTYSFSVFPGWKFLRYFYPTQYKSGFDAVNSFFSVTVNGFTLLRNFSADLTVKASIPESKSLIKEFIIPVNQTLNLTFKPSPNSLAFVNGVEIVSMPDRFYSKGGFDDVITNVGTTFNLEINDLITAFETVYRLNVGGKMVGEVGDSGMFRRWLPDDESLLGDSGFTVVVPDIKINYTVKTPAYVAPEDVYATSRSMGNKDNPNTTFNFNLTWLFTVDAGFNYLVRLHFCETLNFEVTDINQRVFSIFIENQMATREMDVFRLSGGSWIPMYLDFNVNIGSQNGPRPDLRLDFYLLADVTSKYYDAILNGVEILKLNNPDGNLARLSPHDSDVPVSMGLAPNRVTPPIKGKSHVLEIILIVAGSAIGLATFLVVIILSTRQIKKKKNMKDNSVDMFKVLLKHYTYTELKKITKSFSHTVGKGGFGTVYGGNLCNGRKVAVKVLKDLNGNGEDFINEVVSMSQTSHVNIVSLLGYC